MNIKNVGITSIPGMSYLIKKEDADIGILINKSYSYFNYKDIKFFNKFGYITNNLFYDKISYLLLKNLNNINIFPNRLENHDFLSNKYIEFCIKSIPSINLFNFKIVLDCQNVSNYKITPEIFVRIGAKVVLLNSKSSICNNSFTPDNIDTRKIIKAILMERADIGIVLDSNKNNLTIFDNKGDVIEGDTLIYLLSKFSKEQDKLCKRVLGSKISSLSLEVSLRKLNIHFSRKKIHDKKIIRNLINEKCKVIAGNFGEFFFFQKDRFNDVVITSLKLIYYVISNNLDLHTLKKGMENIPQYFYTVDIKKSVYLNKKKYIYIKINMYERKIRPNRILLKYLKKKNKLIMMVESNEKKKIKYFLNEMRYFIKSLV